MTSEALIFTFSCIGISETVYLIKKRIILESPVCPVGEDCLKVLKSKYNKVFIIPNEVLGLLFYIASSLIAAFWIIGVPPLWLWMGIIKLSIIFGSIFSVILTYIQFKVIKAWCFWCLMSALTIWLMLVIILLSSFIK